MNVHLDNTNQVMDKLVKHVMKIVLSVQKLLRALPALLDKFYKQLNVKILAQMDIIIRTQFVSVVLKDVLHVHRPRLVNLVNQHSYLLINSVLQDVLTVNI